MQLFIDYKILQAVGSYGIIWKEMERVEQKKRTFAALRFSEDANIAHNVYWYLSEFSVKAGEQVLAPVGAHNRLQCARVERVLVAGEKDAPYDLRLLKSVEAKLGARKLVAGDAVCFELGGVRYDEKHYTRFRRVLYTAHRAPLPNKACAVLSGYGVTRILPAQKGCEGEILEELAKGGCVLLAGADARKTAESVLAGAKGEGTPAYEFGKYLT